MHHRARRGPMPGASLIVTGVTNQRGVAVLGAFGGVNIGDEMILRAVLTELGRVGWASAPVVIGGEASGPESRVEDYTSRGVNFVSWRRPPAAARAVFGRHLFIGGGQLLDGTHGLQNVLVQLGLALTARVSRRQVAIGGVGAVNLEGGLVRRAYAALFRLAAILRPRDEQTHREILDIAPGVGSRTVAAADVVFALAEELAGGRPAPERRVIGLAIHHAPHFRLTDAGRIEALVSRLLEMLPDGYRLVLLAHDRRPDFDLRLVEQVHGQFGDPRLTIRDFEGTEACIGAYRGMRTIISLRMHPIIIGACTGCFTVPLAGSGKQASLAQRLGLPLVSLGTLIDMNDEVFAEAVGLGCDGPRPDTEALALATRQAHAIFDDLAATGFKP